MKQIRSDIEVGTSEERLWNVLTDFQAFPEWNPFIPRAGGEVRPGARLRLYIRPPGGRGMSVQPTLLKVEPGRELRWLGHLIMPGLFDGEHYFILDHIGHDRMRLTQGEVFTGVLVPLLSVTGLLKNTLRGFEEMNRALKSRAEQGTNDSNPPVLTGTFDSKGSS
jgi:hypothetical protein